MKTTYLPHPTPRAATARAAARALNREFLTDGAFAVKACPGGYHVITAAPAHQPFARAFVSGFLAGRTKKEGRA